MTTEEFIKLIDEEIAEYDELWDIFDEEGNTEGRKRASMRKIAFEMFKIKVLKKIRGSV